MNPDDLETRCRSNLAAVRHQIDDACLRAGRAANAVRLVAVTKYVDAAAARAMAAAGCRDLAESRPQALWAKAETLADLAPPVRWHLIGHLQRNKVRRTLPVADLIHTLDSRRLLETLDAEAAAAGRPCDALVEVNLAGDPGRTGATAAETREIVAMAARSPHVRLRGLMGMASVPEGGDAAAQARRQFAWLREFRDRLRGEGGMELPELSMGMSGDLAEAILEGSTMVRVGSALFEGLL
jgi:pyridoxal phosphate enzyme (YggS family)